MLEKRYSAATHRSYWGCRNHQEHEKMRVTSLGSGSSGNALLVEAGPQRRTKLLIDAGFPGRTLARRLQQVGVTPERLQGICVTHEHTDHVIGLPWLAKHSAAPIISDPRTLAVLKRQFATGISYSEYDIPVSLLTGSVCEEPTPYYAYNGGSRVEPEPFELPELPEQGANFKSLPLDAGARRVIGDIEIISFPVSHDAVAPCGYLLSASGCRVCVVIDSGVVTEAILTSTGHLSNDQAADAILYTWRSDSVRWLWLSHLSRTNNTPGLAFNHLRQRLTAAKANLSQAHISVLPPGMGQTWDSTLLWQSRSLWEM